jgi:elongation factor G
MSTALYKMVKADPSLRMEVDKETGQTVLKGMGELHLEITIDRMRTELGVDANMGKPKVSFREAFGQTVEHTYTHKKQSGGSGQFAEVKIIFEPGESGSGVVFSDEVVGGRIPREYIPAVQHAITVESRQGQVAGYEVLDFKARLIDGKYHDVDSSALAFEIAGRACFREAQKRMSKPKLLEPVMKLEVVTEATYLGDVIGDINRRRGSISDQGQKGPTRLRAGLRAAGRNVRLHQLPAFGHQRPRHLHDDLRSLRRSAGQHGREADGEGSEVTAFIARLSY